MAKELTLSERLERIRKQSEPKNKHKVKEQNTTQKQKKQAIKEVKKALEEMPEIEEVLTKQEFIQKSDSPLSSMDLMAEPIQEASIAEEMFNLDENLEAKTELTHKQRTLFSAAIVYADTHNLPTVKKYVDIFSRLSVSLKRQGRNEGVEMQKAQMGIVPFSSFDPNQRGKV